MQPHGCSALGETVGNIRFSAASDPHAWLTDTLTRLVGGWPKSRVDELMPWTDADLLADPSK